VALPVTYPLPPEADHGSSVGSRGE
jgi:hypothetical protein